jgi:hypothetical protein
MHLRFCLSKLCGRELLRALLETSFLPVVRCEECGREAVFTSTESECPCICGGTSKVLGEHWWRTASARVRAACRRDPSLLAQAKSDWADLRPGGPLPRTSEAFHWLELEWGQTGRPPHRSFSPRAHLERGSKVLELRRMGFSRRRIVNLLSHPSGFSHQDAILFIRAGKLHTLVSPKERVRGTEVEPETLRRLRDWWIGYVRSSRLLIAPTGGAELWRARGWAVSYWTRPRARFRGVRPRTTPTR